MQKDEKHKQLVEENGGFFIPLVVESYWLWTPFALKSIALRTTVRSGLEVKMATRNLFEQLSIKLWSYNAKIILNILSLLPVNPLWNLATLLKFYFNFISFRLKKNRFTY